ncbi:DNA ligase 1-like [Carassius carassius]|uniref:DNA ligase 1-like n=1 Tax=Carassius carassius TaxID=217509 RepID=UPI002869780E|nr:DNA ligase 1-like [Carassius carassius]
MGSAESQPEQDPISLYEERKRELERREEEMDRRERELKIEMDRRAKELDRRKEEMDRRERELKIEMDRKEKELEEIFFIRKEEMMKRERELDERKEELDIREKKMGDREVGHKLPASAEDEPGTSSDESKKMPTEELKPVRRNSLILQPPNMSESVDKPSSSP